MVQKLVYIPDIYIDGMFSYDKYMYVYYFVLTR